MRVWSYAAILGIIFIQITFSSCSFLKKPAGSPPVTRTVDTLSRDTIAKTDRISDTAVAAFEVEREVEDSARSLVADSVKVMAEAIHDTTKLSGMDTVVVTDTMKYPEYATVIGVGDIMLGTDYPSAGYLPPEDANILEGVTDILSSADVTFGNLEGCFLDEGHVAKRCSDPSKCYAFRMPERYGVYLEEAGFDVMSIANNHIRDFGQAGITATRRVLDSANIRYSGLLDVPYTVFRKNGLTYGMAAFSPNTGTCRINNYEDAQSTVQMLDSICDIVIVSFHGGAEGSKHEHVTRKTEYFYGENRGNVYEFSRKMIDAGADIIFGHGPHVTRGVDLYKDRFIIYSMGNFATYGRFNLSGVNGIAPLIKLKVDRNGVFEMAEIYAIRQSGRGIPGIDNERKVIKRLQYLTTHDFPECVLEILEDGIIMKKDSLLPDVEPVIYDVEKND